MFEDVFRGKRALVAGGSSGVGLAIARAFHAAGATVTATGLVGEELASVMQSGIGATRLDVTDEAACRRLVAGFERLDVLVNCAGIIRRGDEHDPAVFARVVAVNLTGTMHMCAAARPLLARNAGCIVNTASMLAFFGDAPVPGYSASKGGVVQLTKSLAIAYAAEGIRVNAVAPGWIATAFTQPLHDDPRRAQAILERTPLGRWGRPEDVAGPVLFLCSPAAAFVTGAILAVDGGYLAA